MLRLICLDVDGTLVGSSGTVLPEVWAAADRARARGIRLAICSGRPAFGGSRDLAVKLDAEGWHIFQNGASVVHLPTGESLSSTLSTDAVRALVERARETGRILELYTDTDYAVESHSPFAREHARLLGIEFSPRPFESLEGAIVRAQWLLTKDQVGATLRETYENVDVESSVAPLMPETTFVMMTSRGVSKASGVRSVAGHYDIALRDVMVVGDGHNDIQAMQEVGFAIAMGNAAPEVRDAARLQVGHVDEGGLLEALAFALAP